jgi:hypothetical protein
MFPGLCVVLAWKYGTVLEQSVVYDLIVLIRCYTCGGDEEEDDDDDHYCSFP